MRGKAVSLYLLLHLDYFLGAIVYVGRSLHYDAMEFSLLVFKVFASLVESNLAAADGRRS